LKSDHLEDQQAYTMAVWKVRGLILYEKETVTAHPQNSESG